MKRKGRREVTFSLWKEKEIKEKNKWGGEKKGQIR